MPQCLQNNHHFCLRPGPGALAGRALGIHDAQAPREGSARQNLPLYQARSLLASDLCNQSEPSPLSAPFSQGKWVSHSCRHSGCDNKDREALFVHLPAAPAVRGRWLWGSGHIHFAGTLIPLCGAGAVAQPVCPCCGFLGCQDLLSIYRMPDSEL